MDSESARSDTDTVATITQNPFRRHLIAILFLSGWVLPSIQSGGGIGIGIEEFRSLTSYVAYISITEYGWFSRGLIIENTWEAAGHGHSFPVKIWPLGWAIPLWVLVTGIVGCYWPEKKAFVCWPWLFLYPMIIGLPVYSFSSFYSFEQGVLVTTIHLAYLTFMIFQLRRLRAGVTNERAKSRKLIGSVIFCYPVWLLSMCVVQLMFPYLGWACTLAGCFLLLWFNPELQPKQPA